MNHVNTILGDVYAIIFKLVARYILFLFLVILGSKSPIFIFSLSIKWLFHTNIGLYVFFS